MFSTIIFICIILFGLLLTFSSCYNLFFALFALTLKKKALASQGKSLTMQKILILIPAHNEEMLIGRLLESTQKIDYPADKFSLVVIADNCTDKTTSLAEAKGAKVVIRSDENNRGKGAVIKSAFEQNVHRDFDAVLIIDADSIVDPGLLKAINSHLQRGEVAIQCFNGIANPYDSWFTRIIYVSRVINNLLFFQGRYVLGLPNILDGNGMCFTASIIDRFGWRSKSISEDKEHSMHLIMNDIFIAYAVDAKVYAEESRELGQAFSQRLRWAGGKFKHSRRYTLKLLWSGIVKNDFKVAEAILPLVLPNHSLQANMTFGLLLLTLFLPLYLPLRGYMLIWITIILIFQFIYLLFGFILIKANIVIISSFLMAPIFLCWKACIDILTIFGYKSSTWSRTQRMK